ncbi:WD repeat, SAM and U-box domain-containing protein 1-like isoform X2 [Adelges cooleyi]|uniref:WD repeat, SAM and U-box domain-containing protein 1-like isoform X2 n=1 Tax=Adelges cooleyi TaxID=133065 RepID=UPI00217FEF9B|nr:WD repeat, SAM and U-box domain-containing protein 1-like isoform X2 [Adelges cooleyi]
MSSTVLLGTINIQTLRRHSSDVTKCCFSKRFNLAIGSSDKTVSVWKWCASQGFVEMSYSPLTHHKYMVTSVQFDVDGTLLATSSLDGNSALCDTDTGRVVHTFVHNSRSGVKSACFTANFKYFVSAGDDGTMCVWDMFRKSLVRSLVVHEDAVSTVCCSKDSRVLITGDMTGVAKVWSVCELTDPFGKTAPLFVLSDCHDMGVSSAEISPITTITNKGKMYNVLTSGNDHLIKHWQLVLWKMSSSSHQCVVELIQPLKGHSSTVTSVCFNHEGTMFASTSMDKTTRLWQVVEPKNIICLTVLEGHSRYINTCAFSEDSLLFVTGSNDKSVIIWDVKGNLDFNSSLAAISEELDTVQNTRSVVEVEVTLHEKFNNFTNSINTCDFSSDNEYIMAAGSDKFIRVWRLDPEGKMKECEASPLKAHHYSVQHLAVSPCSSYMASCSLDGMTIIWELCTFEQRGTLHADYGGARCCSFSEKSELIAVACDNEIIFVWNVETLQLVGKLTGNSEDVMCVTFSPDSRYLMTGCVEGHIRIWPVHPKKYIVSSTSTITLDNAHEIGITTAHFARKSPSAEHCLLLLTGGNDGVLMTWRLLDSRIDFEMKFVGHGSDITCAKFTRNTTAYLASTSLDKTARIWQTDTGECLHVIDPKNSILTCCSFSADNRILATGSLDKTLFLWKLPVEGEVALSIKKSASMEKSLVCHNSSSSADNQQLELALMKLAASVDVPDEFICPITQQIYRDPVICSDGYTYERAAIVSWFGRGKITSPLTNEPLLSKSMTPNVTIKKAIDTALIENQSL